MKWKLIIFSCILFNLSHNSFAQKLSTEIDLGWERFQYGEVVFDKLKATTFYHQPILPYFSTGIAYNNNYLVSSINMSIFEFAHVLYSLKGRLGGNALFFLKRKPTYLGPFVEVSRIRPSSEGLISKEITSWQVKYIGALGLEYISNKLKYSLSYGSFFRREDKRFVSNKNPMGYWNVVGGLTYYVRFSVCYQFTFWEKRKVDL